MNVLGKSMTGYAREEYADEEKQITVEVKSVNNRYLDINIKAPRFLAFAEDKLKALVSKYTTRGKVDLFITYNTRKNSGKKVTIDEDLLNSYIDAFKAFCEKSNLEYDLTASKFLNNQEIIKTELEKTDDEEILLSLVPVAERCLQKYNDMRAVEGNRLKDDILIKADNILKNFEEAEKIVPLNIENYKNRLFSKIKEALEGNDIDESRIITETMIYTDKVCVDEEIVRAKSHIKTLKDTVCSESASGKKMDFIIQELNRETNTLGSKSNDLKITELVVDTKNEIEKIREQIQNLE